MNARVVAVMPVYNEARTLSLVLQSIGAQTFDRQRLYVVVVDGNSNDGSREIIEAWFKESGMPGCVLVNRLRKIPISLNMGFRCAGRADVVVRLDAHTVYGPTYIADAISLLEKAGDDVGCIGAAYIPVPPRDFSGRVVEALYTNPMGLGGAAYRFGDDVREVDSAYLGVWPARVLIDAGGFDERLEANEDAEMSARIQKMGFRVLRAPLPCRFIINRGMMATVRQWHRYGYWRARMLWSDPRSIRVRHVAAPAACLLGFAVVLSPFKIWLLPALAAYGALIFRGRREREPIGITVATLFYFPLVQFAFVTGMLRSALGAGVLGRQKAG